MGKNFEKRKTIMKCNLHLHCVIALTLFVSACGSSNTSAGPAPNTGNIPKLTTNPTPQASAQQKQRISGEVFDAISGKSLDEAQILIQIASAPAGPNPTNPAGTPPPRNQNNPANATPPPSPNNVETSIPAPGGTPLPTATPAPGAPGGIQDPPPVPSGTPDPNVVPTPGASPDPNMTPDPANPDSGNPVPPGIEGVGDAALPSALRWASIQRNGAQANAANNASNKENALNVFKAKTNNRGKFFINDVPQGKFTLTVSLPGYRSLTLTEANPNNLNIPLMPNTQGKVVDVVGMVLSPSEAPVAEATVSSSFPVGTGIGVPALSNELGEFQLPAVSEGQRSLLAFTQTADGTIQQMGLLRDLPIAKKNLKATDTVLEPASSLSASPEPTVDPERRQKLEESVEDILRDEPTATDADPAAGAEPDAEINPDASTETGDIETDSDVESDGSDAAELDPANSSTDSENTLEELSENEEEEESFNLLDTVRQLVTGEDEEESLPDEKFFPVIPLRSVLSEFKLGGTLELPEGYTPRQLEVYLMLPAKPEEHRQEIYMFSKNMRPPTPKTSAGDEDKKAKTEKPKPRFELELPNLEEDFAYHLQFTAAGEDGQLIYHHLYNVTNADETLLIPMMAAGSKIELEDEDINAIPPVPGMGWEAVPGADIYHVVLEAGQTQNRRIVWEAWTTQTQLRYPLSRPAERLKEKEVYHLSVSALKGLRPAIANAKTQYAHPGYKAIWTDLARMTHPPFEVVE